MISRPLNIEFSEKCAQAMYSPAGRLSNCLKAGARGQVQLPFKFIRFMGVMYHRMPEVSEPVQGPRVPCLTRAQAGKKTKAIFVH
jgi:hypothetical protein